MIRERNDQIRGIRPLTGYCRAQREHVVSIAGHTEQQFHESLGMKRNQQRLDALFCYLRALYAKVDTLLWQGKTVFLTYIQAGVNNWVAEYVIIQRKAMPYMPIRLVLFLPQGKQERYSKAEWAIIEQADRRICVDARQEKDLQRRLAQWSSLAVSIQFPSSETQYAALAAQMGTKAESVQPKDLIYSIQSAKGSKTSSKQSAS